MTVHVQLWLRDVLMKSPACVIVDSRHYMEAIYCTRSMCEVFVIATLCNDLNVEIISFPAQCVAIVNMCVCVCVLE